MPCGLRKFSIKHNTFVVLSIVSFRNSYCNIPYFSFFTLYYDTAFRLISDSTAPHYALHFHQGSLLQGQKIGIAGFLQLYRYLLETSTPQKASSRRVAIQYIIRCLQSSHIHRRFSCIRQQMHHRYLRHGMQRKRVPTGSSAGQLLPGS